MPTTSSGTRHTLFVDAVPPVLDFPHEGHSRGRPLGRKKSFPPQIPRVVGPPARLASRNPGFSTPYLPIHPKAMVVSYGMAQHHGSQKLWEPFCQLPAEDGWGLAREHDHDSQNVPEVARARPSWRWVNCWPTHYGSIQAAFQWNT